MVSLCETYKASANLLGNGCQQAFYLDPNVLYISIHVHMDGKFYPSGDGGDMYHCGLKDGLGKYVLPRCHDFAKAIEMLISHGQPRVWVTETTCLLSNRSSCPLRANSIPTSSLVSLFVCTFQLLR